MDSALPTVRPSRYRLEHPLGSGGMGAVYLARDLSLDRQVAIKVISDERAADATARRRLVREARAAAALDHPNICTIYEVLDDADSPAAIVMQFVEGETLAAKLKGGRLDVRSALGVVGDVASALAHAHKRGVIHRDLKPQNIIVTPDGRAKLLDFGIAHYAGPAGPSDDVTTASRLTLTGETPGTPAYMSPEQVDGRALDGRSDLFALGVVFYECLTGERAFKGRNAMEIAGRIVSHHPQPPSALRPELTEGHDEICRRLLAKDPRDRFGSADELLGALQLLSTGRVIRGSDDEERLRKWNWRALAIATAVLVLLTGFVAWKWRSVPSMPRDPQAAEWYRRGTEAVREGLPHSARLALIEAIRLAPDYAPAYIRLAEAEIELDDSDAAQQALLRVNALVSDESDLDFEHSTRMRAVRGLMLRDLDAAVNAYRELAEANRNDPGAWLDVGRALDAAGLRSEARETYEVALRIKKDYAPAHLRRGSILSLEGRADEALAAFDEAERLYRATTDVEGQVEALIRRGVVLNSGGELEQARRTLLRARELATTLENRAQQIRAELTLSSALASEGNWTEAEKMARQAVDFALRAELETVASQGLIELATVFLYQGRRAEADQHLLRAIELAEKRGARTIRARATLQRAAVMLADGRAEDALTTAREALEYLEANRFRRLQLAALTIVSRAHEEAGEYDQAREVAERALRTATEIKDESQVADALENLASQAATLGALPEALAHRRRALDIHRRQNDASRLGFDLVNTADLLIRLGKHAAAMQLLDEVDAGAERHEEPFLQRTPAAYTLRVSSATVQHREKEVQQYARAARPFVKDRPEFELQIRFCEQYVAAVHGSRSAASASSGELAGALPSSTDTETQYWGLAAALATADYRAAAAGAEKIMASKDSRLSYEFEWRIAAIASAAASRLPGYEASRAASLERARSARERLRREWKSDVDSYEARADLVRLKQLVGLK